MRKRLSLLIATMLVSCVAQKSKVATSVSAVKQGIPRLEGRKNTLKVKLLSIRKKILTLEKRIINSEMTDLSDLVGSYHGREASSINDFLMSHYEKELHELKNIKRSLESELTTLKL